VLAIASTMAAGTVAVAGSASADAAPQADVRVAFWVYRPAAADIRSMLPPARCIDVTWSQNANGIPIQLWDCNNTIAQQWRWQADAFISAFGKCLDVAGGSWANGARVQLYQCNNTGAQQWLPTTTGQIINAQSGKCLDASGTANGTRLQIWSCTGAVNQAWLSRVIPRRGRSDVAVREVFVTAPVCSRYVRVRYRGD